MVEIKRFGHNNAKFGHNNSGVPMYITVLCKVVDNFGDIGVAWRLCRRLAKIQSKYKICLVVDDWEAFSKIEDGLPRRLSAPRNDDFPDIAKENELHLADTASAAKSSVIAMSEAKKQSITIEGIEIFPWNNNDLCHEVFSQNDGERLSVILELFQCGRPEWMENILFEEKLQRTVQIIMIDYLTAEKYAEDFHCLQSLTRSAKVQKVNFMPGFTEKTGGLVIDDAWTVLPEWNSEGAVLVFTYENDWGELAESLFDYCKSSSRKVFIAQGRGKKSFMQAAEKVLECWRSDRLLNLSKHETSFIEELPYLNQTEWDKLMKNCSALVIRGEESMSRACLSGIPFIWQAYPQSEEYQLVKVRALLERMKPHFGEEDFEIVEKAWIAINSPDEWIATPSARNDENAASNDRTSYNDENAACIDGMSYNDETPPSLPEAEQRGNLPSSLQSDRRVNLPSSLRAKRSNPYFDFFSAIPRLVPGFQDFALSLRKNGDLAYNLMTYIEKLAIIQ